MCEIKWVDIQYIWYVTIRTLTISPPAQHPHNISPCSAPITKLAPVIASSVKPDDTFGGRVLSSSGTVEMALLLQIHYWLLATMRQMYGQSMERERVKLICEMNCSFGMSDKIILLSSAWGGEGSRASSKRMLSQGTQRFHNHGEGPY